MRKVVAVVASAMLSACTTASVSPDKEALCGPRPTEEQARSAVQAYVERVGLKDPNSAQVRDIRVEGRMSWYNGLLNGGGYSYGLQIAFELNAKNSFGAYVGFRTRHILRTPDGMTRWRAEID